MSRVFSLLIYTVEVVSLFSFILDSLQSIWSSAEERSAEERSAEADKYIKDISLGQYVPLVDIFIYTDNDAEQVVYRSVIGCQAMKYPQKKVYILDNNNREHIRRLAKKLGCEYILCLDNKYAKFGNINNALEQTNGKLIVVIDAGTVPITNFLMRTIGFFQKPKVALVQTQQRFYNPSYLTHNLGIQGIVDDNLTAFSGFSQSCRDIFNCVLCCDSYIVRRTTLKSIGGYLTKFLTALPTSTQILTFGWRIIYLNEVLSVQESSRTYLDFIKERVYWHYSNYQLFGAGETIAIWSKLDLWRKSYFLTLYIRNFAAFFRAVFILLPIVTFILGASPIVATSAELVYYLMPYLLLTIGSYSWSTNYSISFFWKEINETILCYPILRHLIFAICNPFELIQITQKCVKRKGKNYNLSYSWILLIGIIVSIASYLHLINYRDGIWQILTSSQFGLMFFILVYNLILMGIAFLACIDQPERRRNDRFALQASCRIFADSRIFLGYTNNLSESGTNITLIDCKWLRDENTGILKFMPSSSGEKLSFPTDIQLVKVEFLEHNLSVQGKLVYQELSQKQYNLALEFTNVSLEENRQLVEMLYCDMTFWKPRKRPLGVGS